MWHCIYMHMCFSHKCCITIQLFYILTFSFINMCWEFIHILTYPDLFCFFCQLRIWVSSLTLCWASAEITPKRVSQHVFPWLQHYSCYRRKLMVFLSLVSPYGCLLLFHLWTHEPSTVPRIVSKYSINACVSKLLNLQGKVQSEWLRWRLLALKHCHLMLFFLLVE